MKTFRKHFVLFVSLLLATTAFSQVVLPKLVSDGMVLQRNANPARSNAINAAFMALALPYLETLDYVERYAWFPYETGTNYYVLTPDPENPGKFIDTTTTTTTTLTAVGTAYKNQVSTPAIPETTATGNTNVDLENCVCD